MKYSELTWIAYLCSTFAFVACFAPYYEFNKPENKPEYSRPSPSCNYPSKEPKYGYPENQPNFPFPTLVPIRVETANTTPVSLPKLEFYFKKNEKLLVKNIGYTVYLTPYNIRNAGYTTGGPGPGKFYFCKMAQNSDGIPITTGVSTILDNFGYPVQVQLFFCNEAYGSFNNCLNHRDGLRIVLVDILVIGNCDNPLFYGYENALRKVKQPNSTTTISVYDATKWLFDEFPYSYFVYPGAFIDIEDYGKQYFCANMVQPYYQKNPSISNRQFSSFTELLNKVFQPQTSALGRHSIDKRPIVQACCNGVKTIYAS